jgi:hypothetical protein
MKRKLALLVLAGAIGIASVAPAALGAPPGGGDKQCIPGQNPQPGGGQKGGSCPGH